MDLRTERALPPEARQEARFDAADSAGIFVGVRVCDEPLMIPVDFAVDDAIDLAHVFAFELGLVHPSKVLLALEGDPQKETSQAALQALLAHGATRSPATAAALYRLVPQMALKTGRRGLFLFTFAGHGFFDQSGDLLVTREFVARRPGDTGLPFTKLIADISMSLAPRRLVFLDACRTRLKSTRAAEAADPSPNASFEEAILDSRGAAIIASTTIGGLSYDDPAKRNGVFTGAVIDVLRGVSKVASARPYLTAGDLAAAVDEKICDWVSLHRHHQAGKSLGISCTFDPESMRLLPLAVDPGRLEELQAFRERCRRGLAKLKAHMETPLTGAIFDELRAQLENADLDADVGSVLDSIDRLDGSAASRDAFLALHEKRRREIEKNREIAVRRRSFPAKAFGAVLAGTSLIFLLLQLPDLLKDPPATEAFPAKTDTAREIEQPAAVPPASKVPDSAASDSDPLQDTERLLAEVATTETKVSDQELADMAAGRRLDLPNPSASAKTTSPNSAASQTTTKTEPPRNLPQRRPSSAVDDTQVSPPAVSTDKAGTLASGKPIFLADFEATLAVSFASELGVDIATVVWAPHGHALTKKPVYSSGADLLFDSAKGLVRVHIIEIDWHEETLAYSLSAEKPKLDCGTKLDKFDGIPRKDFTSSTGTFALAEDAFNITVTNARSGDKRCVDCRIKANTYRLSATVWGDNKAVSSGIYFLDTNGTGAPFEQFSLEVTPDGRASIRQSRDGRDDKFLWNGDFEPRDRNRLTLEASGKTLIASVNGKELGRADYEAIADVPVGMGFIVRTGDQVPASSWFDDYELTTCIEIGVRP